MVTYAEFQALSPVTLTETEFNKIEPRAVLVLSSLCGDNWDTTDETCKQAVIYQIETITLQGLSEWSKGACGSVSSRSYSIGGESESIAYAQANSKKNMEHYYNGLFISAFAWSALENGGYFSEIVGVRV